MEEMLDFLIQNFCPDINHINIERESQYAELFKSITISTAKLVSLWQSIGFCHGVLNTDNMSVLGLTLDYGPFAMIDYFNLDFISNSSDEAGRYSYRNQAQMCKWNLEKLAEALSMVTPNHNLKEIIKENFDSEFSNFYYEKMQMKLGLIYTSHEKDKKLIDELFKLMSESRSDFTETFQNLILVDIPSSFSEVKIDDKIIDAFLKICPSKEELLDLEKPSMKQYSLARYATSYESPFHLSMMGVNLEAVDLSYDKIQYYQKLEKTDEKMMIADREKKWKVWLEKFTKRLYFEGLALKNYSTQESEQIRKLGYGLIKSKFDSLEELNESRKLEMKKQNPKFILRNYMLEKAIKELESGSKEYFNELMNMIKNPYDVLTDSSNQNFFCRLPRESLNICLSCSS